MGFQYDPNQLKMEKSFAYQESKEGWGLCNDGEKLYKSDGSHQIWILDPENQKEIVKIQVMTDKNALKKMNNLIENKKKPEALKFLPKLNSELMKIAKTGIIKKQNASRNVSRITKKIASL